MEFGFIIMQSMIGNIRMTFWITKTNVTNLTITYLNINEIKNTVQKHFYLLLRKNRVSCTISMASR